MIVLLMCLASSREDVNKNKNKTAITISDLFVEKHQKINTEIYFYKKTILFNFYSPS